VLTLALSVSCGSAPSPEAPATPTPSAAPSAAQTPAKADKSPRKGTDPALQAKLGQALDYVAQIRGLNALKEVEGQLIGRTEIAAYVKQQLDEETPPDVLAATEALLFGFGTVEASFDYRATVISLMTSQLLGFYDPKQKTFFVGGDLKGEEADATLWHELVHALQDQHYDLTNVTDWQPDQGDRQAAVHALAEGDATSAMLDAMLKPRGATALELPEGLMRAETVFGSATSSAPPILVRSLVAPYVDGLTFTNFLRQRGGFAAVDEAWRALPQSTEQLLHPDKYFSREAPLEVPVPERPAFASAFEERFHDVMGEQTLRLLLEEWLPARTAAQAASDWGGDRLAAFSDGERKRWAVAWHLRFDTPAAAERALLALARSAPATDGVRAPGAAPPPALTRVPHDRLCLQRHTNGAIALVRTGRDLAVTLGPFERNSVAVGADPGCPAVLAWATQVAKH
jgi:hypothetical protein